MLTKVQKIIKEEIESERWNFLLIVLVIYFITGVYDYTKIGSALLSAWSIFIKIIPIFGVVLVVMILLNYYVKPKVVKRYLTESSGWKRWPIAILGGIISTGPIYMWYPMMKDMQRSGVSRGLIAAFLYSRAIKPFLLPIMAFYFGWEFVVILTLVMVVFSYIQGVIIDLIFSKE